ncbi:hypothetical protein AAG906_038340 [Vitis piasezkii]
MEREASNSFVIAFLVAILRGNALGIALTVYGREEEADTLIEQMTRDQDPIICYDGMYALALAYQGTANNKPIRHLLHFRVSNVSDDVRRTTVLAIGFVLYSELEQTPRIVSLLFESYNPHVRYGAAIAVGISYAGTGLSEAIFLLEPLTSDVDFVHQGALITYLWLWSRSVQVVIPVLELSDLGLTPACIRNLRFIITHNGSGHNVEYRLQDYSSWFLKQNNTRNWKHLKSCLVKSEDYCKINPIEAGCCPPPSECGYPAANASYYDLSFHPISSNIDCKLNKIFRAIRCYNCDSCMAGVAQYMKTEWIVVSIFNVVLLVVLSMVYLVGCCASRNATSSRSKA